MADTVLNTEHSSKLKTQHSKTVFSFQSFDAQPHNIIISAIHQILST